MLRTITEIFSHFLDNRMPRWPRLLFPAVALFAIIWREKWFAPISLADLSYLIPVCLVAGGIIYYVYFVTIHKLIRFATYRAFGLETYDLTYSVLNSEQLLSYPISPFKVQALLGSFFLEFPTVRRPETVLMSSIFHGMYMTLLIALVYFPTKYSVDPNLSNSTFALVAFVVLVFVMWCDSTFGENAEALAIQKDMPLFVSHLRAHFATSPGPAAAE